MTFVTSLSQIPSEKQILIYLKQIIFGKKVFCPNCQRQRYVQTLAKNKLWRCKKCRNKFSITSLTWLKGMKISVQHLWLLIWCWQKKINVQQVQALSKLSIPTIRRYYALFRDNLKLNKDIVLKDKIQMDEMFVKGACIIGAKDIKNKKIKLYVLKGRHPNKTDVVNFAYHHIYPNSQLFSDGGSIYKGIANFWPVKHSYDIP